MAVADYEGLLRLAVLVALAASLAALAWLERDEDWGRHLRRRFVMGVPWGTVVVASLVVSVYLFVQDGLNHWLDPLTIPYAAWSYFYPLGMATAAFSHSGPSHLVGNMTAAVVVLPLAEYVYGHFPTGNGQGTFESPRTNPWFRALVLFPGGVVVVGLLTALWSWGPVIGFSGVVFAALGFALVRYPLAAVVALVAQGAVVTLYRSLLNPVVVRRASSRFVRPPWAGIAVQGHALGLFLGAVAAVLLLWRRGDLDDAGPGPFPLWLGTVLSATSLGLWAVWWVRGPSKYVLYRAVGFLVVIGVGLLVAGAVTASDRDLVGGDRAPFGGVTRRQAAVALLVVPLLVMAMVAVPLGLNTVSQAPPPGDGATIQVNGYTVVYAENVPNRMYNLVNEELLGGATRVNTSGVIVINEGREIWSREVPPGRLAATGRAEVVLGGPGWRETVIATRQGWSAFGGGSTYKVWLRAKGEARKLAFVSEPATAEAVVAGYNLSVAPTDRGFEIRLSRNGSTVAAAPMPARGESVTLANVTFVREDKVVVAVHDGTKIPVFRKNTHG